jgi:bifunctional UDP-N-acetylglucosamine pyrophosphorylase / glucosamine-1-phosphate N-acetyltransferase
MFEARTVIVLAAGMGKRMHSALPKMMHPLLGRPLVGHVLYAAAPLRAARTLVVVGNGAEVVSAYVEGEMPGAQMVLQAEQRGTGHATRVAMEAVPDVTGTVVVLCGDNPLLRTETVEGLLQQHAASGAAATVLTAVVDDPTGFGRIIHGADGSVVRIVEHRDATPDEREIREMNSGIFAFRADLLRDMLGKLSSDNDQGEELLTDVVGLLVAAGQRVEARTVADQAEVLGCNDRAQLATLRNLLRDRVNGDLMRSGVTMVDPATTWIDVTVTVGLDALIEPGVQLRGATTVGVGATVGPDTTLTDVAVGDGAAVVRTHGISAVVGPGATVGPFAYLRPGTDLAEAVHVGTFVETKNATIGARSKVPHLTYVGDATLGVDDNIGAGVIFANYDGVHKHHTTVGDAVFVGSDSTLVAPRTIGDGAYIGAGSTVTKDVESGELGVTRAVQRNLPGWVELKRAGTKSAKAAAAAAAEKDS